MKCRLLFIIMIVFYSSNTYALDPVRNYSDYTKVLSSLGKHFTVKVLAHIQYAKRSYPLYKISYNNSASIKQKKFLIISGIHGDEPAPVLAIQSWIQDLNNYAVINPEISIDFLYIANPWGFEYNQRLNGSGIDINRDLSSMESQEIKFIRSEIDLQKYDRVFDFHEANSQGFFLYCYGGKNRKLSNSFIGLLKKNMVIIENKYVDKILKVHDGILFVPWYASLYMNVKRTVTTGLYFSGTEAENVFTFETSKNQRLEERLKVIRILLESIIEKKEF